MPGFRPGKVPANLVRKMHGPELEQEALQTAVQDSVQKLLADSKLRPAMQHSVDLAEGYEAGKEIGRASCRARVCKYVEISVDGVCFKKKHKDTPLINQHKNTS